MVHFDKLKLCTRATPNDWRPVTVHDSTVPGPDDAVADPHATETSDVQFERNSTTDSDVVTATAKLTAALIRSQRPVTLVRSYWMTPLGVSAAHTVFGGSVVHPNTSTITVCINTLPSGRRDRTSGKRRSGSEYDRGERNRRLQRHREGDFPRDRERNDRRKHY